MKSFASVEVGDKAITSGFGNFEVYAKGTAKAIFREHKDDVAQTLDSWVDFHGKGSDQIPCIAEKLHTGFLVVWAYDSDGAYVPDEDDLKKALSKVAKNYATEMEKGIIGDADEPKLTPVEEKMDQYIDITMTTSQWIIVRTMIHSSMTQDWVDESIEDYNDAIADGKPAIPLGFTIEDLEELQAMYPEPTGE